MWHFYVHLCVYLGLTISPPIHFVFPEEAAKLMNHNLNVEDATEEKGDERYH